MPARHRSHEKCQSVLETFEPRRLTFVVPQTNHDQLVRWDDQRILPSDTGHVVGALGHGEQRVSIYPEEPTVDRTMIGAPSGSHRADELQGALLSHPLALTHSVLRICSP